MAMSTMLAKENHRAEFKTKPKGSNKMSFFIKPQAEKPKIDDDYKRFCSVDGCGKLWAVRVEGDKPRCSQHQWGKDKAVRRDPAALLKEKPSTVSQWYERDEF
jgi:hypothetical protein